MEKTNKIFSKSIISRSGGLKSNIKYNRDYLLSKKTGKELNVYLSFSPFTVFNDAFNQKYKPHGDSYIRDQSGEGPGALGVRSLFNKSGAVMLGTMDDNDITTKSSEWRISNNVPLMDSPDVRRRIRANSGCTVKELVEASQNGLLGRSTYDYSDFMYCKNLGKVSNNYLITLRRFPLPVDDFISAIGEGYREQEFAKSQNAQSIGCMVTWLGVSGNEINEILKYSYNMPFEEQNAEWNENTVDADSGGGILNGIAATFDSTYRKQYMEGTAGGVINDTVGKYLPKFFEPGPAPYTARDFYNHDDRNKVYGPVDTIKSTYMRSDKGLSFEQSFTLTFDYELRSYNGINGRQAMLDLISNILNVTYSTGTFWGGGYRGSGAHQNNIFANMNIFKKNPGGFTGYIDALSQDYSNMRKKMPKITLENAGQIFGNMLNQLGGMILAGKLNQFGRPQKQMVNSLLSPAPIGFWHVTIGNPHHPIMSIGNMVITNTTIEHYGPLGLDDFPTGLKVTVELKRGKPRDIRDIEKLYMHGNDRIYSSMGPKIFDMYKHAEIYKGNKDSGVASIDTEISTNDVHNIQVNDGLKKVLKKYFGHADTYSIYVAAAEQEYGAHKKPSAQEGPSSGDSRVKGTGGQSSSSTYLS